MKIIMSSAVFLAIVLVSNIAQAEPNVSCPSGYYPVCDDEVGCWCKQSSGSSGSHSGWITVESMAMPVYRSTDEADQFDVLIQELDEEELNELLYFLALQSKSFSR